MSKHNNTRSKIFSHNIKISQLSDILMYNDFKMIKEPEVIKFKMS